jgi:iron(III) transport system substrate-binding protein
MHRILSIAAAVAALSAPVTAQPLTAETHKLLAAMKLDASVLAGLDRELAVPAAWVEAAKREGSVKVRMTLSDKEFDLVRPLFEARYPGVKIEYTLGIGRERSVAPLLAFQRGTILSDVLFAIDPQEEDYRAAKALTDLRDLPGHANIADALKSADGFLVGTTWPHYCMSYNTKTVKKEELPKTWEALVADARWRDGKVGMGVNVQVWLAPLWGVKGDAWTDDYMGKLFTVLKPQLRKEQMSTTPKLNALGEFELSVPVGDFAVRPIEDTGATVSFHCPDYVPRGSASMVILAGTPRLNAAKLFVNWALSKEGQLALYNGGRSIPAHKDLQIAQVLPYPNAVLDRKLAAQDARVRRKTPELAAKWHELWVKGGGGN